MRKSTANPRPAAKWLLGRFLRSLTLAPLALVTIALVWPTAGRGDGAFTTIDVPGERSTRLWGMNSVGDVVGQYQDSMLVIHGFVRSMDGAVQTLDVPFPDATFTAARAINDRREVVGRYGLPDGSERGWLFKDDVFTLIEAPGSTSTIALGINNAGDIVGAYNVGTDQHGFVLSGGCFFTIDVPDAVSANVRGINDAGDLVGVLQSADGASHGYVWTAQALHPLDFPDATGTFAGAINSAGEIVGRAVTATGAHGFLFSNNAFTEINFPNAIESEATGIANNGDIVGFHLFEPTVHHGFRLTRYSPWWRMQRKPNPGK